MELLFINSVEDIKKYIPVDKSSQFKTIQPYLLPTQEKFIKPIIGEKLYCALLAASNNLPQCSGSGSNSNSNSQSNSSSSTQTNNRAKYETKLIELIQRSVSNIAYAVCLPILNVSISDGGIMQQHGDNFKPAFNWAIDRVDKSLMETGFNEIDRILQFLYENLEKFPEFKNSQAYLNACKLFVNTTEIFNNAWYIFFHGTS
jgi:hypothetical protein